MNTKPVVVFCFPDALGGVASFNYNIINFATLKTECYTKVILIKSIHDNRPKICIDFKADETIHFTFSEQENQYFVLKRLAKLIGFEKGSLVCDNDLAIQASNLFECQKTVFHLVHDSFYVQQALKFAELIDCTIVHSRFFKDCLLDSSNVYTNQNVHYLPYGVQQLDDFPLKQNDDKIRLVFLGRFDVQKGVDKLIEIEKILVDKKIAAIWTIIGKGPLEDTIQKQWKAKDNVEFCHPQGVDELYALLSLQDIFILPTAFEGTPVSLIECMSNGIVPVITDLPGGISDIVTSDVGFKISGRVPHSFAHAIEKLNSNKSLLSDMQRIAYAKAKANFDILSKANAFFEVFMNPDIYKSNKTKIAKLKMSMLDKWFLPNWLVKFIRGI